MKITVEMKIVNIVKFWIFLFSLTLSNVSLENNENITIRKQMLEW